MHDGQFSQSGVSSMSQDIITRLDQMEDEWRKAAETQIQI